VGDDDRAISMDDPKVFGPVVFRLGFSDAISLHFLGSAPLSSRKAASMFC
jgi:predicted helicase